MDRSLGVGSQGVRVIGQSRNLSSLRVFSIRLPRIGTDNLVSCSSAVEVELIQRVRNLVPGGKLFTVNAEAEGRRLRGFESSGLRGQSLKNCLQGTDIRWSIQVEDVYSSAMRKRFEVQLELGQTAIEKVRIPLKSRDELPPILAGLQWIFLTPEVNEAVFQVLEQKFQGSKTHTGRPGMDLWHILILGVCRLGLDCDYDRLEYQANHDLLLRIILGLSSPDEGGRLFHHRTLSENVCLIDDCFREKRSRTKKKSFHSLNPKRNGSTKAKHGLQ